MEAREFSASREGSGPKPSTLPGSGTGCGDPARAASSQPWREKAQSASRSMSRCWRVAVARERVIGLRRLRGVPSVRSKSVSDPGLKTTKTPAE